MIDGKIVVGITQGDINGIGYEVILKTLSDSRIAELCVPVVYGSPKVAAYHRKVLGMENFSLNPVRGVGEANPKRPNIINCMDEEVRVELGRPSEQGGLGAIQALRAALADAKAGHLDVLVTAPISKHSIQSVDFKFPGHTEYLADAFGAKEVLMLMVSESLRVGVVTGHVALGRVPALITPEAIVRKARVLHESLLRDFAIRGPRIAILSLNPHAGENGVLGDEEQRLIAPALAQLGQEGVVALGPYPADGLFGGDGYSRFDAVLAMYHDQGLTPFKALAYGMGVNFTAGLPLVRTSPAHGTAFEIAGTNTASPSSFRQALYLALDLHRQRKQFEELSANPLRIADRAAGQDR